MMLGYYRLNTTTDASILIAPQYIGS